MRELVWQHAMNEAYRLAGDKPGNYKLSVFGRTFSLTVTNSSSGTNYSITDRGRFALFAWRSEGVFAPFMSHIHARGFSSVYAKYAKTLDT